MKILTISGVFPNPSEPGIGTFVQSRVKHLASLAEVKVMAPVPLFDYVGGWKSPGLTAWNEGELAVLHPRWVYPPFGGFLNSMCLFLWLLGPVLRLRRQFGFQLIDAHFGHPEGVAASLLGVVLRCPFTVTLRGSEVVHAEPRLRRLCIAWALRRADRVITVSERLRQFAIRLGVNPNRVKTIPNGVDAKVFFPRDRAECRLKHNIPSEVRLILSAGHLTELKGHHRVVRALSSVVASGTDARLLIAGGAGRTSGYERNIRREVSWLGLDGRVQFCGLVPSETLAELMSAADVLCLASSREGWPNVVHEALSCGTPVVASDVGAVSEMIPSQDYGLAVPPDDLGALTEAMLRALQKRWNRTAIAKWGQSRSWEQVALEVLAQMEDAVKEEPGRG